MTFKTAKVVGKDFLVVFPLCFLIYLAEGWYFWGPWGSASGNISKGLISTFFVSFPAAVICTHLLYFGYRMGPRRHWTFSIYAWRWVFIWLAYKITLLSWGRENVLHGEVYYKEVTIHAILRDLPLAFLGLALFATICDLRSSSAFRKAGKR